MNVLIAIYGAGAFISYSLFLLLSNPPRSEHRWKDIVVNVECATMAGIFWPLVVGVVRHNQSHNTT